MSTIQKLIYTEESKATTGEKGMLDKLKARNFRCKHASEECSS